LLAAVVAITESYLAIFKVLQPRVTNSDAKDVASEVVEYLATLAGRFAPRRLTRQGAAPGMEEKLGGRL